MFGSDMSSRHGCKIAFTPLQRCFSKLWRHDPADTNHRHRGTDHPADPSGVRT